MKYIIDVNAFKSVLDLIVDRESRGIINLVTVDYVKKLIDAFPKEEVPKHNTINLRGE